tara:strand:- start:226 stop:339 length:114 start_codon:yes stop_codon:yes gene_type:complete
MRVGSSALAGIPTVAAVPTVARTTLYSDHDMLQRAAR